MNYDEFAFFNQQLAAMLRDGIALEAALKRLSADMRQGVLRAELERLAADLSSGVPLREAARARKLPDLYRQLLEVGVASNDLPGILTLLSDYYLRRHTIWTRLKGLMVYPAIVLACSFLLSCFLSVLLSYFVHSTFLSAFGWSPNPAPLFLSLWLAPIVLGLACLVMFLAMTVPRFRRVLRWRLPAFREFSLAQVGSSMFLMLKSGVPLNDALALVERLEEGTPAQKEIASWRAQLSSGRGKFSEMSADGKVFPPLFRWMVGNAGEDLGAGFQRASEIYQSRAAQRTEMMLYSALPCAVFALGIMVISQVQPAVAQVLIAIQNIG